MALLPLLDIARSGLLAQEVGLSVVGNNIANVNTPGYSRERAILAQEVPGQYAGALLGRGVRVRSVEQVVDPLIDRRLRGAGTDRGEQTARREQLARLSALANDLDEPSLATSLDTFFDAADALARNPAGMPERQVLLGRAAALAGEVNRRSQQLGTLQRAADDRIAALVAEANGEVDRIAELNGAIAGAELSGQAAAPLRDERELALQSLARKVGVDMIDVGQAGARVSLTNGVVLVEGARVVNRLAAEPGTTAGIDAAPLHDLGIAAPGGGFVPLASGYQHGEIAGLRSVRDGELMRAATQLDAFAATLASAVNAVQQNGAALDLDGNPTVAVPLFTGTTAATLGLAVTDPRRIAAARSTEPGDAANALALADLRSARHAGLGSATLSSWLAAEQARIGQEAGLADDVATAAELLATQVRSERDAVSGVNLNEELANLLRFQHAFEASAKLVAVADRVLDELVNLVR